MTIRVLGLALAAGLVLPAPARADYDCSFEQVANRSTTIVDATVLEITKDGKAKLKIHRHLYGANAPATLTGVHLTCFSDLPERPPTRRARTRGSGPPNSPPAVP